MNTLTSFLANARYTLFFIFTNREIFNRIFRHLEAEGNYGYPFSTDEELRAFCDDTGFSSHPEVAQIERDIARMPKAYGDGVRYILHRDLKARGGMMTPERLQMYRMFARENVDRQTCDPRFVARRA